MSTAAKALRATRLARLGAAFFATSISACGGGDAGPGGGSAAIPIAEAALLPAYDFSLSDAGEARDRLVARSTFGGAAPIDVTIDFRIEPAVGRYTFASKTIVFEDAAIAVDGNFGPIVIDVVEPLRLAPGGIPNDVSLEISVSLVGLVRLRFSEGIVEMRVNNDPPRTMSFDEFEALLGSPDFVPLPERQSSLAWAALDLLRHLITLTADSLSLIDAALEASISVERMCDAFTGPPPPGALNQGLARLAWLGSGQIRNGDRFQWDFTSCWRKASERRGILIDGRIRLDGFSVRTADGAVTRIGYESFDSLPGGVFFDELDVSGTVQSPSMTFRLPASKRYTLARGLRILFTMP